MSLNIYKSGFTLAEVLITLGIIGVIAAMTIPTLYGKCKATIIKSKLQTTHSIIAQALKLAEADYGPPEAWGLGKDKTKNARTIAEIMKQYMKISEDCGPRDIKGICAPKGKYKYLSGGNYAYGGYAQDTEIYKVILANGSSIFMRDTSNQYYTFIDFYIDINGPKPPNVVGLDLFAVSYYPGVGSVLDGCYEGDDTPYEKTCKGSSTGWGCACYIVKFGNMNYLKK